MLVRVKRSSLLDESTKGLLAWVVRDGPLLKRPSVILWWLRCELWRSFCVRNDTMTHLLLPKHKDISLNANTQTDTHKYILHTHTHTHTQTHTDTQIHTHRHTHTQIKYTFLYTYCLKIFLSKMYLCMYVWINVCVWMCVCMYACMCVCVSLTPFLFWPEVVSTTS